MASDSDKDRRRAERVPVNAEFAGLPTTTYVTDLSENGVFVHASKLTPIGTEIDLRFTVLLDDPVVLEGRGLVVRHSFDPKGMGIEFVTLDPHVVLRINDVVARGRPRDSGPPIASGEPLSASVPDVALPATDFVTRRVGSGNPFEDVTATKTYQRGVSEEVSRQIDALELDDEATREFEGAKTLTAMKPLAVDILDEEEDDDPTTTKDPKGGTP